MKKSLIDEAISLTQANLEQVNITLGPLKDFELDIPSLVMRIKNDV